MTKTSGTPDPFRSIRIHGEQGAPPGFSGMLDLRRYERETRRRLLLGFAFGAEVLALLAILCPPLFRNPISTQKPYRTIIADIVEIPASDGASDEGESISPVPPVPGVSRLRFSHPPFSLRDFTARRDMRGDEYRKDIERSILALSEQIGTSLADSGRPNDPVIALTPERETRISRRPDRHRSLREEGLNISDLDGAGRTKGVVLQDPADKRKIKGFFHIARQITDLPRYGFNLDAAPGGLAEAMTHFTEISQTTEDTLSFRSPDLFRYPVLYLTSTDSGAFTLDPEPVRRFGDYLRGGGFSIVDNGTPWGRFTPAEFSLLNLLLSALGNEARFDPIPSDHPLFHSFFDLSGNLPDGAQKWAAPTSGGSWGDLRHNPELEALCARIDSVPNRLWGVWINERLVAVYCDRGYGHRWRDGYYAYRNRGNQAALELGVNLLVFALIQRGGVTEQYVDYSGEQAASRDVAAEGGGR